MKKLIAALLLLLAPGVRAMTNCTDGGAPLHLQVPIPLLATGTQWQACMQYDFNLLSTAAIQGPVTYLIITGTETVQGNAFSVGGSTFVVKGGNVGIGTPNPSYPLHVYVPQAQVRFQSTTGTNDVETQYTNTGGTTYFGNDNSAGNRLAGTGGLPYSFGAHGYGTQPYQITVGGIVRQTILAANGNVGFGTTAPAKKLDVNGDTIVGGHLEVNIDTATLGTCTGGTLAANSSSSIGSFTTGTGGSGSTTSCQVNFASAFASTPFCLASMTNGTPTVNSLFTAIGTGSFTYNAQGCSGCSFAYLCVGPR